jgi:transposase InsO family protein
VSRFRFVADHYRAFGVKRRCRILRVSRSGFYRWRAAAPARAARAEAENGLAERIARIHAASGGVYGAPRVHAELAAAGEPVNRKRIARIMRQRGVTGRHLRKRRKTTVADPAVAPVPDRLRRDFGVGPSDQRWCGDIERHEAPCNRVGVRDRHRGVVAAIP